MASGVLRDRIRFDRRADVSDDYGGTQSDWAAQFTRWAEVRPLKGGEGVIAARLEGTQPVLIRVRFDSLTKTITPDWRAVDARDGTVYAIKTAEDMERRRQWITCMCEAGVAA